MSVRAFCYFRASGRLYHGACLWWGGGGGDLGLAWEWKKVGGVDGDGGRRAEIGRSARTILHTHVQFNHPRRSHGTTRVTQEKPQPASPVRAVCFPFQALLNLFLEKDSKQN